MGSRNQIPSYLLGYEELYQRDPKAAAIRWFTGARLGLFIHFGLYSILGRGEWVQFVDRIPIAEYEKLAARFNPTAFDAGAVCDLAAAAEMRYVNFVCKHCDSFAMWQSEDTEFNAAQSASGRDFVGEMADACASRGLGFFVFYEHGFDWRHPHGPAPWLFPAKSVRPAYDPPEPFYADEKAYDFGRYVSYAHAQIRELVTNYGPVAGVWFDGVAIPLSGDHRLYRTSETYRMIRDVQPQALISYKFGLTGEEDFFAPEDGQLGRMEGKDRKGKPMEVCGCMQLPLDRDDVPRQHWGYNEYSRHRCADDVWGELARVSAMDANYLLNIGPLPDGSVHPEDEATLIEIGKRIRSDGFPSPNRLG